MTDKPKIAYFGSDKICLPGLRYLFGEAADRCELTLIVSQPDRRSGRGKRLQQNPVAEFATAHGIPLLQPEKPDRELAESLQEAGLSLAFVMAYGHFLPKAIRDAPAYGMLNFHGSILPAYRGASPVETAIAVGEEETGVSLMEVVREMDAGAVADVERIRIEDVDTAVELRAKVGEGVVPLLWRHLGAAVSGQLEFKAQDASRASYCRKIKKEDAALDFYQTAQTLERRRRAFQPWPGAYFDHGETRIKVGRVNWRAGAVSAEPGTVLAAGSTLDVATAEGILQILELQRPGGRMLPVEAFLKGYRIDVDSILPSVRGEDLLQSNHA
ncbi:methionyl-tRNA formyltransferase [Coraliomargarita sinensis]|uniref:Methionyl-tRNA formyltransferase n=1 Tax=Coraliomargarita sinensis TaxID=2174842 RepID=A0A317ZMT5_9BACT|nr:methionyl-tRNA formyltransferase [Coraliomargarita sinensis]PXA05139.1 methionyl-tRNA formyltransferase [Coraliomargarita sinensis]